MQARNTITGDLFTLCGVYKPPSTNLTEFIDEFGSLCEFFMHANIVKQSHLIISDDFIINLLRYSNKMIVTRFLDMIYSNGLFPSIILPTRVTSHSSTLIDNVFVNQSSVSLNGLIKYDNNDHFAVFVVLNQCVGMHDGSRNSANYLFRPLTEFFLIN